MKQLPSIKTDQEENATGAIHQAIKDFTARLEDELSFKVGDKLEVISDDKEYNDGWYMGKSLSTGKVGLYPKSFAQLIPSISKPLLLRSRSRRLASPTNSEKSHSSLNVKSSGAPASNRVPTVLDNRHSPKSPPKFELDPKKSYSDYSSDNHITGALSDIDKALEELKNDVQPRFDDRPYSEEISVDRLSPESVLTWTPEQVTSYFKYLGFDSHSAEQFSKHKITGRILLELELTYLKELDISSFGTRFELFKEIEALKEVAQSAADKTGSHTFDEKDEISVDSSNLSRHPSLAAAELETDADQGTAPLGLTIKDFSNLNFGSSNSAQSLQEDQSKNITNPPSVQVPELPTGRLTGQFLSPRKAPQPPSYPSPVQLQGFSAQNTPVANKRNSYYESVGHSRKPSYDINPSFQVKGASHSRKSSYEPLQHSRNTSKSITNFKSSSSADILSTLASDNGRPASSVYMDSVSHSRHSSVNVRNNGHSRMGSDVSPRKATKDEKKHRRHSSVFSFMSNSHTIPSPTKTPDLRSSTFFGDLKSARSTRDSPAQVEQMVSTLDPKAYTFRSPSPLTKDSRRSVSAKEAERAALEEGAQLSSFSQPGQDGFVTSPKRSVSEAFRSKTLRNISSSTALKKTKNKKETSAFMEGIKSIGPQEALKTADYHGWMNKRGGIAVGVWKQRYFTLHGTRLSYFTSLNDKRERGLIDITSHKVLPTKDDDKLVSLYAASTGNGKFCFKLVPPAPGSRKGLTFTQPKVHYFAVETKEEMRNWMAALVKATIDIDDTVPVLSSCATPTVSLQKAQSLLAQARENARKREDARYTENLNRPDLSGTSSSSPDTDSYDSNLPMSTSHQSPNTTVHTAEKESQIPTSDTPSNGLASPFEIASNTFATPKSNPSPNTRSPVDKDFKYKSFNSDATRSSNNIASTAAVLALNGSYKTDDYMMNNNGENRV